MSTRRTCDLRGILVAVTTPFTANAEAVDQDTLQTHADHLIRAGVHGLVTTGSTGEFPSLTRDEYRAVIAGYVQAADHRVPVVAGIGALSTRGAVDLAQYAESAGADAIMLLPPFYGGVDIATLTTFLTAVAESISIPIIYYNIPSATGTRLTASQLADLGDIPGLDYLKDTSGDAVSLTELLVAHASRIQAFNGWDTLTFLGIASGAKASVWGVANFVPELAVQFWDTLAVKGDLPAAREQWKHLWAISDFLESVDYAAGVKAGLEIVGRPAGPPRPPVLPLTDHDRERFTRILAAAGQVPGS